MLNLDREQPTVGIVYDMLYSPSPSDVDDTWVVPALTSVMVARNTSVVELKLVLP